MVQPAPAMVSDGYAKDAIIGWFRGEFAAANAIIDALCNHLTQLQGHPSSSSSSSSSSIEYEAVFSAIHRRRMNWIPILQMQKYYSIADVALELRNVVAKKAEIGLKVDDEGGEKNGGEEGECCEEMGILKKEIDVQQVLEEGGDGDGNGDGEVVDDSPESDITDSGSQEVQPSNENGVMCSNHANCEARSSQIKMTKGFSAKEHVRGHMVNVVRGLKLYDNVLTDSELSKFKNYVNELRVAGQNGELPGGSYDS